MKYFKKYLSLRFKDAHKNDTERMNINEWEEFRNNAEYFSSSDDFLVEAAIEYYEKHKSSYDNYFFAEDNFDNECKNVPGLENIKKILKKEKTNRDIELINNDFSVSFRGSDVLVSYYPPYIISFDTTYRTRINVDLSLKPNILVDDKKIIIKFGDRNG